MNTLQLPKMSTHKPVFHDRRTDNGMCINYLNQEFRQKAPNLVWVSDLTYLKAAGKWYYLCIIMDLFSRKVIAWRISKKPDVELTMTCFRKAYEKRNAPYGLIFHSDRGSQYTAFAHCRSFSSLFLNISKDTIIPKDHIVLLVCLL